jgi:hypothetical protein
MAALTRVDADKRIKRKGKRDSLWMHANIAHEVDHGAAAEFTRGIDITQISAVTMKHFP